MQQLSGMDASFLYGETQNAHMAGAGLSIYDPSTAPGGRVTFKGILESHRGAPRTRPRCSGASGSCGCRSTSTTRTGSRIPTSTSSSTSATSPCPSRATGASSASRPPASCRSPLDLDRPLWEFYVIEGLDNVEGVPPGSFAVGHQGPPRGHRRHVGHGDDERDPRRLQPDAEPRGGGLARGSPEPMPVARPSCSRRAGDEQHPASRCTSHG